MTEVRKTRLSRAETRILEQFWKLGTSSVREILGSLPDEERVAYTTIQTLVYRLDQKQFRNGLVRDLLDLFGGSPRLLVSNLLETGTLTLKDLKVLQAELPRRRVHNRATDEHE